MAQIKGAEAIRSNLSTCLTRGEALAWYAAELTDLERLALRFMGEGVDTWCQALVKRFKDHNQSPCLGW